MPGSVQALKKSIRSKVRETVRGVDARSRAEASARAVELLLEQKEWREAKSILLYVPREDELDLRGCLGPARVAGKLVALPRYLPDQSIYCAAVYQGEPGELTPGRFGIPEPPVNAPMVPLNRLDLALVPGVAFDPAGRRLGRGKGFYDRLLADVTGVKCGVALDEQIVPELPEEPHDMAMNYLLTPARWLSTGSFTT